MSMDLVLLMARLLLAGVFGTAGVAKLADWPASRQAIIGFGVSSRLATPLSILLPLTEITIALSLLSTATAWWGALCADILLLLFIISIGYNLARGRTPDCPCFGRLHSAPASWLTLARNGGLAVTAGLIVWQGQDHAGRSLVGWLGTLSVLQIAALVGVILMLGLVAVEGWLLFDLLQQRGRLLLRIEALEAQLAPGTRVSAPATPQPVQGGLSRAVRALLALLRDPLERYTVISRGTASRKVYAQMVARGPNADVATVASIEAARAALATGATQVSLSPGGRLQYRRLITNGVVTFEEIQDLERPAVRWTHSDTQSILEEDYDGDGFFERRSVATRGMMVEEWRLGVTSYDSAAQPVEHMAYTFTRMNTHIEEQQPDDSSSLKIVNKYDRPLESVTLARTESPSRLAATHAATGCCDPANLRELFQSGVDRGLQCLHRNGATDLELRVTKGLFRYIGGVRFGCASLGKKGGLTVLAKTWPPILYPVINRDVLIEVNHDPGGFCSLSRNDQLAVMFHEATHLDDELRSHDPNKELARNRDEVDRTYACTALCFSPADTVSQCTCATCLGTTKCDARCEQGKGYQSCPDDFGAWCPCLRRLRWYPSCAECLAGCPSGLFCSGFKFCIPVNKGLCTARTCP